MPARGPQSTWYDHKFRPVATQDGNGKLIINQYDSQDRLWKSFLHQTGSVSGEGINNSDLSSLFDNTKRLSELTYTAPGSTWVQESHNRLLRQMPETATPYMVRSRHDLDDIGRAVASTVTYPDADLFQNTDYSSAGFVKRSTREVYHHTSGATQRIIDIFSHDDILRPEKHRIQYGPDEHNDFVMANHLVYDEHDRLIKKFVGGAPGNENQFLQEVNYAYDAISRLLRINDPGTFGCNIGEEVCELSLELKLSKKTLEEGHCRRLQAIQVDNLTYTLPAPLDLTAVGQAPVITAAIQQALDLFGLDGTANLVDIRNDADYFYFSTVVTGTQAGSMSWVLQSCDQSPAYSSDCCIIAPPSVPPAVQNNGLPFSNCADLYHQRMRYNGLDIANITLGSSCDARLVNNYSYDALHRITAMHNTLQRPGLPAEDAYSTSYSYDRAGNIQRLSRRGFVGMSGNTPVYDLIDDLHYSYAPGANPVLNAFSSKLQGVDDMVTDAAAQPHGVFLPSSGYGYDDNGNMISAGSVSAEYNILNLPTVLSTSSGTRKFEYVFGGGKYSAQLITGNQAIDEMRHYLGGMEFKDGILEAYNFGDGRVVWENSVPKFQYRLADHLGNTVVFFEDKNNNGCITTEEEATSPADLEIVQRLLYYPFGMALEGLGAWNAQPWQQYRYNGKERDTLTGWYDYGARWGLLDIGRWNGVDPLAEFYPSWSPYNYALNNPITYIDPDGQGVTNEYEIRKKNGKVVSITQTGTKGGDERDYITEINEDKIPQASAVRQYELDVMTNASVSNSREWPYVMEDRGPGYRNVSYARGGAIEPVDSPIDWALGGGAIKGGFKLGKSAFTAIFGGLFRKQAGNVAAKGVLNVEQRTLQHMFSRHAKDFGVTSNWNKAMPSEFEEILRTHMKGLSPIQGTYRGTQQALHYYNPSTGLNVMTDMSGNLLGGWKLSADQVKYLLSTGAVK